MDDHVRDQRVEGQDHDGPTTQGEQHGHFSGVQLKRHLLQVSTNGSQHNPKWTVKPFDEVYPGIFLGDVSIAKDKEGLRRIGVTHVLNAAQGRKFNQIDTDDAFYSDIGVAFLGIPAIDVFGFKMSKYFATATDFIENALCSEGGKVLVHCQQGLSRSSSLVLAFLMLKRGLRAVDACTTLRQIRPVMPNDGFLEQLAALDCQLYCQDRHD
ncbi:hypothetical protein NP493_283g03021 [Ridgeia piscesae]|uniref:Dual specificity protein phosphatase n=1 Tax=Ridgeia piscesae TaxID=27915 RepID=A0AAD9UCC6_RIDPI|nr:hypothetical protein NP493_283g03021 [Ridgeia piscesae]